MKLRLIRHATLWLEYAGVNFLIDPMFSNTGVNPPIVNSTNERRNPLVPMPFSADALCSPDAVIITHMHLDHWDDAAAAVLSNSTQILCQPGDDAILNSSGFNSVTVVDTCVTFKGVTISRTSGQHGTGDIGQRMGLVSGFVLKANDEPTVYIAGDTIWCDDVLQALDMYRPDVTVVNAGGARFKMGDSITMNAEDVVSVCRYAAFTKVVAVHMDAINHCLVTREDLHSLLVVESLLDQVVIPRDGDWV